MPFYSKYEGFYSLKNFHFLHRNLIKVSYSYLD